MEQTDWAYLAGFMDGDGCITWSAGRNHRHPRIRISQTDHEFLEQVFEHFGIGRLGPTSKGASAMGRPQLLWTIGRRADVKEVLTNCMPYLRLKQAKAREVLDELEG